MQKVSKKRDFFQVRKKMGLRMFLRDWDEFAAKTEFGVVLEYFCKIGVGLRIICPSKRGEGE